MFSAAVFLRADRDRRLPVRPGAPAPRGQHARISICLWLAAYPAEALEYVMVHELCHIYAMSHSPKFWMYVERFVPDYVVRRRLLKR